MSVLPPKIAAALSFVCALAQSEGAEQPPAPRVEMEVYAGVSPAQRDGLTPITTILRNRGRPVGGMLHAELSIEGRGVVRPVAVQLPAKSSRRVQMYGPGQIGNCAVSVILRTQDETIARTATTIAAGGTRPIVIDRRPSARLAGLRQLRSPSSPPRWALPDTHWAYAGIPAIVLGDARLEELTSLQTRAIVGYVRHGGTLIVSAGHRGGHLLQTFLRDLLPGATSRVVELPSLAALGDRFRAPLATDGPVACSVLTGPGVEVELHQGPVPVVAIRPALRGRVVWIGFDVFTPQFSDWPGATSFWPYWTRGHSRQLTRGLVHGRHHYELSRTGLAPAAVTSLILFFGAYILCLGPGVAWLSKRTGRTMTVWGLLPLVALAFSALTPLLRDTLRNQPSSLLTSTLLEQFPGRRLARYEMAGLVRSRGQEAHRLALPSIDGTMGLGTSKRRQCVTPASSRATGGVGALCQVRMWGTQVLDAEGTTDCAPVEVDGRAIMLGLQRWRIELRNCGACVIPGGTVLVGPPRNWQNWPPGAHTQRLEPGQTRSIRIGPMNAPVRLDVWPWAFCTGGGSTTVFPHTWVDGCIPFVIGDEFGGRYSSSVPPFASTFTTKLAGLPWPQLQHDRLLRHEADFRTLVVWIPVERQGRARTTVEFGTIVPRIHRRFAGDAPTGVQWRVHEFRLPRMEEHELSQLRVRVRCEEPADGPEFPLYHIYDYRHKRWRGLTLVDQSPSDPTRIRTGWRTPRPMRTFEAFLASPEWAVARPGSVVTLRESRSPQGGPRLRARSRLPHQVQIEATFGARGAREPIRTETSHGD